MGCHISNAALSVIFTFRYLKVGIAKLYNLSTVCLCAELNKDRWLLCIFDSGHALAFHFLLNSLVNAEVCFVNAFKSHSRTI